MISRSPPVGYQRSLLLALLLAVTAGSCTPSTLLNSERIERRFGSYAIEVLSADDRRRISSLSSLEDGRPVTRTLAVVTFPVAPDERVATAHARVVAGESIGAVFRESGWRIDKVNLHAGTYETAVGEVGRLMNVTLPVSLTLHAYRFDVNRDGATIPYATIVELHHPAYLSLADVHRIYGDGPVRPATQSALLERRVAEALDSLVPHVVR